MKHWFAITYGDVADWSLGSYDLDVCKRMAALIADFMPDVVIAAIDEEENFCDYELYMNDDSEWVRR